jgi:uncharacterized protein (DUF1697 family)
MALVVLLRAANVGGHHRFRPGLIAKELGHLGIVNVGAAGTFVAPGTDDAAAVGEGIRRLLPFPPEMMVRPASEIVALASDGPFRRPIRSEVDERYLTVLTSPARAVPRLPIGEPPGRRWQVRLVASTGPYVLSVRRAGPDRVVYPNAVVERRFGVPATTRTWSTVERILQILEGKGHAETGSPNATKRGLS